ncbi:hypothetical protein [Pseudotabrizicola alkalilacus]|uniref:Uncharacterized protein n=1 Tax=Pseudotabrizicola alkalilacus TaxID=2305252 RepID=A0A411YYY3_9RHOB|nr:hypothetical protein [Pseudotabrizicola alkalilacus]RGP36023.1 hypothetical protein D1012_16525 [Pseudotabrizicola alkalilacus]
MLRIILQWLGVAIILVSIGGWWLLDGYGCAFNTSGCARLLPRLTREVVKVLTIPIGLGLLLIVLARRKS